MFLFCFCFAIARSDFSFCPFPFSRLILLSLPFAFHVLSGCRKKLGVNYGRKLPRLITQEHIGILYGGPQGTSLQQRENTANKENSCKHKEHVEKNQLWHTANKKETKKNIHTTSKRIAHCKQNSRTLQTKKDLTVKRCTLQARLHAANKTPARCKQERNCKNITSLQAKELHAANKTPARCSKSKSTARAR